MLSVVLHGNQCSPPHEPWLRRGAGLDWLPGWENATPLDIAARVRAHDVIRWLHSQRSHPERESEDMNCLHATRH